MRRLFIVIGALTASAALAGSQDELLDKWNEFAKHANFYAAGLNSGVKDLRMRKKLVAEWDSMVRCECW
jgi:hypothetical protein